MADGNSTEVIVLDLRTEVRARREELRARRALRTGLLLKSILGAVALVVAAVLFALLRRP